MKIFITGVSSGIGRGLVKLLIKEGHEVWGVARRENELELLKSEIGSDSFFYSICNISLVSDIERTRSQMRTKNFLPDIVVLNAAAFIEDAIPQFNYHIFEEVFKTNVFGALKWVDLFIEDFLKRDSGQFIAISSTSAFRPNFSRVSYSATKAAISMAFRGLNLRYRRDNIFFKVIYFGPIATPMSIHVKRDNDGKIVSKNFFVAEPEDAVHAIIKAINSGKSEFYSPFISTTLFRLINFLPDSVFVVISRLLKK